MLRLSQNFENLGARTRLNFELVKYIRLSLSLWISSEELRMSPVAQIPYSVTKNSFA